MTATPSTAAVLARICHERLPAWWNGLSDYQRKMLKGGSLPMSEWAFEAGVVAGLDAHAAALSAKDAEIATAEARGRAAGIEETAAKLDFMAVDCRIEGMIARARQYLSDAEMIRKTVGTRGPAT